MNNIECNCNSEAYGGCHHRDCPVGIAEEEDYLKLFSGIVNKCVSCGTDTKGHAGDIPTCERCYRDGTLRKWMDDNEID